MAPRSARHRLRDESRRLEYEVGRVVIDLGVESAHGAGETDDARVIADHDIVGIERPGHVVQGLQGWCGFSRPSCAHGAAQLGAVEGMQRLAELEHDVVGDIDREGHRSHPGRDKTSLHPVRSGGCRIEADDAPQGEELAHPGVIDPTRPGRGIRCRGR